MIVGRGEACSLVPELGNEKRCTPLDDRDDDCEATRTIVLANHRWRMPPRVPVRRFWQKGLVTRAVAATKFYCFGTAMGGSNQGVKPWELRLSSGSAYRRRILTGTHAQIVGSTPLSGRGGEGEKKQQLDSFLQMAGWVFRSNYLSMGVHLGAGERSHEDVYNCP